MTEIILDTETTGLDPAQGHRVVEIGALELINHIPSGRSFHAYLNPERDVPREAEAVHGLTTAFLAGKPVFAAIVDEFLEFVGEGRLIIHNAGFDLGFLNAELGLIGRPLLAPERVIDTLQLARQRHPLGSNSLDALCKRYGIDAARRDKHGALIDAQLLADVYLELIGGRQAALGLAATARQAAVRAETVAAARPRPLNPRLTEAELAAHATLVAELGPGALWRLGS